MKDIGLALSAFAMTLAAGALGFNLGTRFPMPSLEPIVRSAVASVEFSYVERDGLYYPVVKP